jgi:hypothetical protein
MRKSVALNLFPWVLAIIYCSGAAQKEIDSKYSMTQATVQQPSADTTKADFSERIQGGMLLRFEFGLIIVKPTASPGSLQPTALTTDAIITSSIRSKIAGRSGLLPGNFEIQTDAGVVKIRSKGDSLDQAAEVINLVLGVPEVRQIVYMMPSSAWKTASLR